MIVRPLDELENNAPAKGEAHDEEHDGAGDALPDRPPVEGSLRGKAERDGNDDPADRVIDNGRGKDHLADVAPEKSHVANYRGDDFH